VILHPKSVNFQHHAPLTVLAPLRAPHPPGLLRMMGGDVTVTSEPGKGSVFTVRLPGGADTH
jgi:hypothetical protein